MNADDNYHGEGNHRMVDEDYADKTELLLDIIDSLESGDDRYHINNIIITVKNYMSSLHDYVIIINNEIIIRDTTNTNDVINYNHTHTHTHEYDNRIYKLCQNYFIIIKLLIIISSKVSSLTTDHLKLWKVFHQHFKQYHQYLSIQIIFDYCQLLHMYLIDGLYNLQQYVNHQHHHQQQHYQHNQHCKIDKHHDINSSNNTIIHDNSYDNSNDDNNRNDYNSSKKLISFFLVRYMYVMSMYRLPLSQLLTSSSSSSSSLLMDSIITLLRYQGIISYIHSLSSFNTNTTSTTYTSITTTSTTINNNDDDSLIYNANDIVICDELFMKNFEYICKLLHYNHHNDNDDDDHQGRKHNNGGISDDNARYDRTNSNKLLFLLCCIQHKSNNWIEEKTKLSYLIDGVMLLLQYIIKKENSIRRKEKEEILFQRRNDNHNINNDDGKDYNKDDGSGYIYECIYIFLQSMRFYCLFIDNNNTSNGADNKIINNNYDDISDDGMLIKYLKQFIKLLARFMGSCNDHNSIRRLMVSKT